MNFPSSSTGTRPLTGDHSVATGPSTSTTPLPCKMPVEDEEFNAMAREAAQKQVKKDTYGFGLHSCALQIKDQARSKWFYTQVLGMDVVKETESNDVTMIFLAFPTPIDSETPDLEFGQRRGLLQLIHVAGDESDDGFQIQHGHPGFCHLCVNVSQLDTAVARMKSMGVTIVDPGSAEQGYAVISDPDGYNIQLLFCSIDQSRALKRQLEKIITSSSGESSHRISVLAVESANHPAEGGTGTIEPSAVGLPDFSTFRGGSPDFQHPHWSKGPPRGGSPVTPTSPVRPHHIVPLDASMAKTEVSLATRPTSAGLMVFKKFEQVQTSTFGSTSSTAYSHGSSSGRDSRRSAGHQLQTHATVGVSSTAGLNRSNAPNYIAMPSPEERPFHRNRRKTMSPNQPFGSLSSSYHKLLGNAAKESSGADMVGTHKSLPSSPTGTREAPFNGSAHGPSQFFHHRKVLPSGLNPKRASMSGIRSLRERLPFLGNKQR